MPLTPFHPPHRPLIIGHRGASGHAVENSLAAFRLAASPGIAHCDGVELDVHGTADGVLVVHHDPVLSSGAAISAIPADRVRRTLLADGSPIPTLAEVLDAVEGLQVFIEAKGLPAELDVTLCSQIAGQSDPARCHVHSFDHRIIARLRHRAPQLSLGALSCSYPLDPVGPVREIGASLLWQEAGLIDRELVTICAAEGIGVVAWTVNDVGSANRLRELGVAGLCGNWPERLRGMG